MKKQKVWPQLSDKIKQDKQKKTQKEIHTLKLTKRKEEEKKKQKEESDQTSKWKPTVKTSKKTKARLNQMQKAN